MSESNSGNNEESLCEICRNEVNTLVLHQIFGGVERNLIICPGCASLLGIEKSASTIRPQVGDLLAAVMDPGGVGPKDSRSCPRCGTSYSEIRLHGKCGCAECYDFFSVEISGILRRVSSRTTHRGKLPRRLQRVTSLLVDKPEIEKKLLDALQSEDYEKAVRLRDEIEKLEKTAIIENGSEESVEDNEST